MGEKEAPETVEATGTEIAPAEATPSEEEIRRAPDVYRRMELEDERLVMEELQGRGLDVMLYSFEGEGGRPQIGFSVSGAAEAANTLNRRGHTRIRISPEIEPRFEETRIGTEEAIRCTVYAEDVMHGGGVWATAEQARSIKKRGGAKVVDPFAYRKALSKAQRNAFEKLIPLELIEYLKAQYVGAGKVKMIPGADRPDYERPPALTDARAKKQTETLRQLYDSIKQTNRLVMPPGQFNAIITGAQHDHDRLDEAIEHLADFLHNEQKIAEVVAKVEAERGREFVDGEAEKMLGMNQQRRLSRWRELAKEE